MDPNSYVEMLKHGREWSWSVIAIGALLGLLILRHLILRKVLISLRSLPRDIARSIELKYAKKSLLGWMLVTASVALMALFWLSPDFFGSFLKLKYWILFWTAFYLLSLFSHINAYVTSICEIVNEQFSNEKGA